MSFDADVVVVGGGPAGTSTALHLVRREGIDARRIVLVEKAKHPRDKPCAGAISAWGLRALDEIGVPLTVPYATMRGLRVLASAAIGEHVEELGVVIRRCEFDASLWHRAAADGVVAVDGTPVTAIERVTGGWRVVTAPRSWTARFVAACDGVGSSVRKLLGVHERARKGHLYVAETRVFPGDEGPGRGLCDFDLRVADDGIEGYYWDFPTVIEGQEAVNRGIYHANFTPRSDLKEHLARALVARGLDAGAVRLRAYSTRPLVRGAPLNQPRLALVGEAAGIDATTGEGIAQAILMGGLASVHIARALRGGDPSLDGYAAGVLAGKVGRHLLESAWLAKRVYGRRGDRWRTLLAQNALARAAGAKWYAGAPLDWLTKARLGVSLTRALFGVRALTRLRAVV